VVVLLLELVSLLYLSILFLILLAFVGSRGPYDGRLLLLAAGLYGLVSLWWLLVMVGLPGKGAPSRIPSVVQIGLAAGLLVAGYFIVTVFPKNGTAVELQALALFGAPIATCAHLLVRFRSSRRGGGEPG
jgi:hypothetical protein